MNTVIHPTHTVPLGRLRNRLSTPVYHTIMNEIGCAPIIIETPIDRPKANLKDLVFYISHQISHQISLV